MTGSYKVVAYKFSCLQGKILCMFTNNNNQVGDKRHDSLGLQKPTADFKG